MTGRRFILPVAIAAVLLAGGIIGVTQYVPDPLDDYRSLRRRAEVDGQMTTAVRGQVVEVRDGLFQLESEIWFPQRLWVLSRSAREVTIGERVAVQGTLFARGTRGVHKALLPDDMESELCRDGLLVADTLTIYQGQMHG